MLAFLHCWQPANTARVSCPVQGQCRKAKKHYGSEGRIWPAAGGPECQTATFVATFSCILARLLRLQLQETSCLLLLPLLSPAFLLASRCFLQLRSYTRLVVFFAVPFAAAFSCLLALAPGPSCFPFVRLLPCFPCCTAGCQLTQLGSLVPSSLTRPPCCRQGSAD